MMTATVIDGVTQDRESFQVAPIDLKHLRRYTLGDEALEREILELFLGQLPVTIEALKSATCERDWKVAAHTLKGSSRAVGAWHISRLAEHAERLAAKSRSDSHTEALDRIDEAVVRARSFIAGAYGLD